MTGRVFAYIVKSPGTSVPVYVGKGNSDRPRKLRYRTDGCKIGAYLRGLHAAGKSPEVIFIEAADEADAFEMEEFLIDFIGREDLGTGTLFNLQPGGAKTQHSEASKKKMSEAKLGKQLSSSHKAAISKGLAGYEQTADHKRNTSESITKWWSSRETH